MYLKLASTALLSFALSVKIKYITVPQRALHLQLVLFLEWKFSKAFTKPNKKKMMKLVYCSTATEWAGNKKKWIVRQDTAFLLKISIIPKFYCLLHINSSAFRMQPWVFAEKCRGKSDSVLKSLLCKCTPRWCFSDGSYWTQVTQHTGHCTKPKLVNCVES